MPQDIKHPLTLATVLTVCALVFLGTLPAEAAFTVADMRFGSLEHTKDLPHPNTLWSAMLGAALIASSYAAWRYSRVTGVGHHVSRSNRDGVASAFQQRFASGRPQANQLRAQNSNHDQSSSAQQRHETQSYNALMQELTGSIQSGDIAQSMQYLAKLDDGHRTLARRLETAQESMWSQANDPPNICSLYEVFDDLKARVSQTVSLEGTVPDPVPAIATPSNLVETALYDLVSGRFEITSNIPHKFVFRCALGPSEDTIEIWVAEQNSRPDADLKPIKSNLATWGADLDFLPERQEYRLTLPTVQKNHRNLSAGARYTA